MTLICGAIGAVGGYSLASLMTEKQWASLYDVFPDARGLFTYENKKYSLKGDSNTSTFETANVCEVSTNNPEETLRIRPSQFHNTQHLLEVQSRIFPDHTVKLFAEEHPASTKAVGAIAGAILAIGYIHTFFFIYDVIARK